MSGINFIGSYSGIDQATIDKLMEAHKAPLVGLANKKTSITDKQNAWKDINTRLNSLFDKLKNLEKTSTFSSKTGSSTNDDIVSISIGNTAPAGTYDIKVDQLATSTRIIGGTIPETSFNGDGQLDLEGFLTIGDDNGNTVRVEITKDMKSANDVTKAINKAIEEANKDIVDFNKDAGPGERKDLIKISATSIDGRLVLTNEETGDRNIEITGDGRQILNKLGLNKLARQDLIGENASFNINGVDIRSRSNTVTDAIEGMTINLHRAHDPDNPRDYERLVVDTDIEKASKAVKEFVDQYNSTMRFIDEQVKAGDPDSPGSRGKLAGESALIRLQSRLRTLVTSSLKGDEDSINDISQIGVSTVDRYGQLEFDSGKFTEAMRENPSRVIDFFRGIEEDSGYVDRLKTEIDGYISTKKDQHGRPGIIKSTMESYDRTIKDINRQIDRFNDRMERKEEQYIKMFTALDVAMMQAESQMQWLQGQVDAMNGIRR